MTGRISGMLAMLGAVALISGCSTIPRRIAERHEVFESFPAEVQANLRQGIIEVGYTRDMVYIAKGSPDQVYMRQTEAGEASVWSYTKSHPRTTIGLSYGVYGGSYHRRGYSHHSGIGWGNYADRSYEYLRIEWDGDRVKAIERLRGS